MEYVNDRKLFDLFSERFEKLYPGKRLLAVNLNGFSHTVFYDHGTATDEILIDKYSGNMPEGPWSIEATKFFVGIGHMTYQVQPEELVFVGINER